ncbi:MAG TPA: hypothetical protein VF244_11425 [Acidimicrobiales bacterium]
MSRPYHFVTTWRVKGTLEEVKAVLGDGPGLPRWWPSVYLDVKEIDPGAPDGLGRTLRLHTKGWLPYTLKWDLSVTRVMSDAGFSIGAAGDLTGTGDWTFEPQGSEVVITYVWQVAASKPLLRRLAWLLRPAFAANHHWAMNRGQESLQLEMRRLRATTPEELAAIPPPPPATFGRLARRGSTDTGG